MPGIVNDPAVALYVVAAVALIVMAGFFVYLWSMDRRMRELQRMLDDPQSERSQPRSEVESEPLRPQRIEKELSNGLDRR
jgi:cell division protein FtsL